MTRSYIPLNSLRAFEAAARHLNFTHAAIELNVTHSAISQHVKALEQHLNCQLFVRVSRGLMLTTEGENLLPVLNDSFDRIAGMLDRFASHRALEKLKIGVVGTFATGVLFAQLDDFRRQPAGGDGDFPVGKGRAEITGKNFYRLERVFVIGQRLAHAHHHDVFNQGPFRCSLP